jgi:hypothetical protein
MTRVQGDASGIEVTHRIPYFQASPFVVRDARLSAQARTLYVILCSYANGSGESWPAIETLVRQLGSSEPTLKRARRELVDAGYLRIQQRLHHNGRQRSNLYVVLDHVVHKGVTGDPPQEGVTDDPLVGVTGDPGRGSQVTPLRRGSQVTPLEVPDELEGCTHGLDDTAKCPLCRVQNRKVGRA